MNKNINLILNDLYSMDPELKEKEPELVKIIEEMIAAKPDAEFTKKFAKELEKKILAAINSEKKVVTFWNYFSLKSAYYAGGGLMLILIMFTAAYYNFLTNSSKKATIDRVSSKAFGSLIAQNTQGNNSETFSTQSSGVMAGFGRGGGGSGTTQPAMSKDMAIMPNPYAVNYNYVYKGEKINQQEANLDVIKKENGGGSGTDLIKKFSGLDSNLIDMNKFTNLGINNLSISENKDFGYMVTMNSIDNSVMVYANWEKWPRPENDCMKTAQNNYEECYNRSRLKVEEMPSDEEVINTANQFLKEYGVNTDNYGEGKIMTNWRDSYEVAEDKNSFYIPDSISVSYPLKISGLEVYDESGYPNGLTVEVNARHKKASGVYPLTPQNYQSSKYEMETDNDKILTVAQNGGIYGNFQSPDAQKTIDVELGTPTLGYMRYYKYNNGISEDLYIPALIFPITNKPDGLYKKNIVVPLEKEILAQAINNSNENPVRIMQSEAQPALKSVQ